MIVIAVTDNRNGILFHERRQSSDRDLRKRILERAKDTRLWVSPYTRRQFTEETDRIREAKQPLSKAGQGELCFLEEPISEFPEDMEALILYRWNRDYPADVWLPPVPEGWHLIRTEDFQGYSHGKLTEEVYEKCENE